MNILRCTAIITHHTAGLDKLGSLNSEGSGALLRWAAPEQRCSAGTPSKIQPSLSAMKLTAWARLVAPATRAGRSTTSCSCTRWSAPSGGGAQTSAAAQVEDLARADRRLHGRTQAGRGRAAVMSEVAAAGGTARRSCIRVSRYLHQHPVRLQASGHVASSFDRAPSPSFRSRRSARPGLPTLRRRVCPLPSIAGPPSLSAEAG